MSDAAPRALVFDCDGTLADTMPGHFAAWNKTMRRYGIEFPEDRFYALGGVPTVKIIRMLADEAGVELDAERVAEEKELTFQESLHEIGPVEPVVAIAERCRGQMPMAVATGTVRWLAERVLGQLGVRDWFEALICGEDVAHAKPEPDIYREAARRLGVKPAQCRAYEDTDLGLESAARAGMHTVDIRSMHQPRRVTGGMAPAGDPRDGRSR